MHRTHLNDVLGDAAIARAIRPAVEGGAFVQTRDALTALNVAAPALIAAIVCPKAGT